MTGGAVKRELRVMNRFFILLLFACFFVAKPPSSLRKPLRTEKTTNKAKDEAKPKETKDAKKM